MKKPLIFFITLFSLVATAMFSLVTIVHADSFVNNTIEHNFIGISNFELVNVDNPDDSTTILQRIYFFSMRQGFIFFAVGTLMITLMGIIMAALIFAIFYDFIIGTQHGLRR